jgi:hypothetical protein
MPSTNFIQVNPNANNQETDSAYSSDSQRSGGMVSGVFASILANKIFYQSSTFITAFANFLVAKGYSPNDGSASPSTALANLQTVFANLITSADLTTALAGLVSAVSIGSESGYIKFGSTFGGLTIQWGVAPDITMGTTSTVTFSHAFSTNNPVVIATSDTPYAGISLNAIGKTSFNYTTSSSASSPPVTGGAYWLAIGN